MSVPADSSKTQRTMSLVPRAGLPKSRLSTRAPSLVHFQSITSCVWFSLVLTLRIARRGPVCWHAGARGGTQPCKGPQVRQGSYVIDGGLHDWSPGTQIGPGSHCSPATAWHVDEQQRSSPGLPASHCSPS